MTKDQLKQYAINHLFSNDRLKPLSNNSLLKLHPEFAKSLYQLTNTYFSDDVHWSERLYVIFNDIKNIPHCPICGEKCKFISFKVGYRKTCGKRTCANKLSLKNQDSETKSQRGYKTQQTIKTHLSSLPCNKGHIKSYFQVPCVKLKMIVEHYIKTGEFKHPGHGQQARLKAQQTELKRYGRRSIDIISSKDFWQSKYGVDNVSQLPHVKKKLSQNNAMHNPVIVEKLRISRLKNNYHRLCHDSEYKLLSSFDDYLRKDLLTWLCTKHNITYNQPLYLRRHCPQCRPDKTSNVCSKIAEWLTEFVNIRLHDRSVLYPYEIDIWIPDYNLGIEVHGIYWHCEQRDSTYKQLHSVKANKAEQANIRLLQFFEDEIRHKEHVVKSIILHNLNMTPNRVYARQCTIRKVSQKEARQFVEANHISSFVNCSYIGLYYNDELVMILGYSKPRFNKDYDIEIVRIATKTYTSVVGGLSKLIKHLIKTLNPSSILCYVDRRFGTGRGLRQIGFELSHITQPGYFWVDTNLNRRLNRVQLQKHKLLKMFPDVDPTLSESQILESKGWVKIWDAGCGVFVWKK